MTNSESVDLRQKLQQKRYEIYFLLFVIALILFSFIGKENGWFLGADQGGTPFLYP